MPASHPLVRDGKADDAVVLSDIYAEASRTAYQGLIPHATLQAMIDKRTPQWWQRLMSHDMRLLVLETAGEVHGYTTLGPSRYGDIGYAGEVYEIYMRPSHQGLGLGSELLEGARTTLDTAGLAGHMAWALADSAQSCAFLAARGGREFARSNLMYPRRTLERIAYGWPS
jgi:L-amino acid N-acyltransferase YncA